MRPKSREAGEFRLLRDVQRVLRLHQQRYGTTHEERVLRERVIRRMAALVRDAKRFLLSTAD